jgi:hypothetical protein
MGKVLRDCLLMSLICAVFPLAAAYGQAVNVLTRSYDNSRTGQNTQESILKPANVNQAGFGKLFSVPIDGYAYAQPLYLSQVNIAGGVHNVVYVATEHDSVYAIDADNGTVYWQASFVNQAAGITSVPYGDLSCGDLRPEVGITGTPVIDPSSGTIYLVAKTKENGSYVQRLHALSVATGAERPGSPVVIAATVSGTGDGSSGGLLSFNALRHMNRPGLLLQGGHVIIAWASHCDVVPYHGWLMSYNASSLAQEGVYNTSPNSGLSGIWMSGNGVAGDSDLNLFFSTGNGPYDGTASFGDSILKLGSPSGTFPVRDWFTPSNQGSLNSSDIDLGSGGLLLLPDQPSGSPHQHLLTTVGKEGKLYLVDRDQMGHFNSGNDNQIVQNFNVAPGMWGSPAWWNNKLYLAGAADVGGATGPLKVFAFNPNTGLFTTSPSSFSSINFSFPAPTPIVSANGTSDGIVWVIQVNQFNGTAPAVLRAYDASNLAIELYNSQQRAADDAGYAVKFTVPVVANGKVYVGTQAQLSVYGLLSPLTSVNLNPSSVVGGTTSSGAVTLNSSAPAGGLTIALSSDNATVASVPSSITVPQGTSSANFTVITSTVANSASVVIHASYSGTDRTATLTVQPWLSSLSLNPTGLIGGSASVATINLNAPAPAGGALVSLTSSAPSIAAVPVTALVPVNATSTTFQVTTTSVISPTSADISAAYFGTKTATLNISPAASILSIALNPNSVTGGAGSTGTVALNSPAPASGTVVALSSSNTGVATVPANVTVAANSSTVTFPVGTQAVAAVTPVTITGTYNGSANATLTVNPPPSFSPIRINAGGPGYTDSLGQLWNADGNFSGGTAATITKAIANTVEDVLYQSERWGVFNYTFTVPSGGYLVKLKFAEIYYTSTGQRLFNVAINGTTVLTNFDIVAAAGGANTAIDQTFSVNAGSGSNNLVISFIHVSGQPDDPKVDAIEIVSGAPTPPSITTQPVNQTVTAGQTATFSVVATGTPPLSYQWRKGGVAITGATSASYTTPATVVGDSGSTFDVQVSNSANTVTSNPATLTVTDSLPALNAVSVSPTSVIGGNSSTGTVTLSAVTAADVMVTLSDNSAAATTPAGVIVPAGSASATFIIATSAVSSDTTIQVSAVFNGTTRSATLTVSRPALVSLSLNPTSVKGGSSSTGTVTLSGPAPASGVVVALSDNRNYTAVPASVTVPPGAASASFTVTTSAVSSSRTATISGSLNRITKSATLTVTP